MSARRIGIFAGSFDPVHDGHLQCAKAAIDELGLDRLYFVVEPRPRRKQGVKAFEHRSEMVRLAITNDPKLKQIVIDEPYCTTEDTIPMLKSRFPESSLYLLMGDDVARRISDWSQADYLFENATLVVARRTVEPAELQAVFDTLSSITGARPRYHLLQNAVFEHNSTDIKKQLKHGEEPEGISPAVLRYIKEHNLYGSSGLGS